MSVRLLYMKIDILVEVKVLAVAFIPAGLQLSNDGSPSGHNSLATQKNRV